MAQQIIKFDYNGSQIPFEKGSDVMVNLTAMAKAYPDKNLSTIVNSQEISDYCTSLSKLQNFSFADLLIVRKGAPNLGGGTWAHRLVATRVAQKLNSDLAVWVDMKIEELMTTGSTSLQPQYEVPHSFSEALMLAARQQMKIEEQQQQIELKEEIIESQDKEIKQSAPKVVYYDIHLQSVNTLTTTQIAKEIGMDAEKLNNKLKELGLQFKQSGQWLLKAPYDKWGMHSTRTNTHTRSDGSTSTSIYTVWTQRGRRFIIALYENEWSIKKSVKQIKGEMDSAS